MLIEPWEVVRENASEVRRLFTEHPTPEDVRSCLYVMNWRLENYTYAVCKQRNGKEIWSFFVNLRDAARWIKKDEQQRWRKGSWKYAVFKNTGEQKWVYERWLGAKRPRYEYQPIDVPLSIALLLEG